MLKICLVLALIQIGLITSNSVSVDILMPNVSPKQRDLYLCHKLKLDENTPYYITAFHPKAKADTAHHMLLFTCEEPPKEETWDCGEMSSSAKSEKTFPSGPVCKKGQGIIYAWALDAPELTLPKDVAFKIGGNTKAKYLVLQVHYASIEKFLDGKTTDRSGIVLSGQLESLPNLAAVYFASTGGYIKANEEENFEAACEMKEDVEIFPFAYRAHAHKLGLVNSGYVIKHDETGKEEWIEIGRRSPQLPQMFYPVTNEVSIKKGDIFAARCTMENTRNHNVYIGATNEDEMCNFYMMYYVKGRKTLDMNMCYSPGPPFWYFKDFKTDDGKTLDLKAIPKDISEVPEDREEEMSNHENMHMNMGKESSENSREESTEYSDESGYVIPDEYVDTLKELEKEAYYKNLINKKLQNQKLNRFFKRK